MRAQRPSFSSSAPFPSLCSFSAFPVTPQVSGVASVLDGDTLKIGVERIRLQGIDMPESRQICRAGGETWRCGASATWALLERLAGRLVAGAERDRDRYGRIVAVCRLAGEALKAWMVESAPATAPVRSASVRCPRGRMWRAMRSRSLCARALGPSWLPRDGQHGMPTEGRNPLPRACAVPCVSAPVNLGAIPVYGHAPGTCHGQRRPTCTFGGACDTAMRSRGSRRRRRQLASDCHRGAPVGPSPSLSRCDACVPVSSAWGGWAHGHTS